MFVKKHVIHRIKSPTQALADFGVMWGRWSRQYNGLLRSKSTNVSSDHQWYIKPPPQFSEETLEWRSDLLDYITMILIRFVLLAGLLSLVSARPPHSNTKTTTSVPTTTYTPPPVATVAQYGQCGGIGKFSSL